MRTLVALFLTATFASAATAQSSDWQAKWDQALAAAKKEGKIVIAGSPDPVMRKEIIPKFTSQFGITVDFITGRSSEIGSRLRTEREAGIHSIDILLPGLRSTTSILYPEKMLDPVKPMLIRPDVVDPAKWKTGEPWFIDPEKKYVLRLFSSVSGVFHINTDQVKPDEMKTPDDLLNPKWRGKISTDDPAAAGRGANTAAILYTYFGEEFVKKLYLDQNPMISRNRRQLADWLARGTYPISLSVQDEDAEDLRKEGFHIKEVPGLTGLPGILSGSPFVVTLINKAPHPNAALIFINWIASKEPLEIYSRSVSSATLRTDVDESFLPAKIIPKPGVKYFDSYGWDWATDTGEGVRRKMKELLRR
ncbi:MAG: extracellular solute-binding protein [Xanthobacteraceae bacterium]